MKVANLKKVLRQRGLPMTGKKADLVERLKENVRNSSMAVYNNQSMSNDESFGSTCKKVNFAETGFIGDIAVSEDPEFQPTDKQCHDSVQKKLWQEEDDTANSNVTHEGTSKKIQMSTTTSNEPIKQTKTSPKRKRSEIETADEKENACAAGVTPKKHRPLGFMSSSPRLSPTRPLPLAPRHDNNRTPVSFKHTISTAKKRIVNGENEKQKKITASTKKRTKKGMSDAVAKALGALDGLKNANEN